MAEKRKGYKPRPMQVSVRKGGQKVMKDGKLLEPGGTEPPEKKRGSAGELGSPTLKKEVSDGKR